MKHPHNRGSLLEPVIILIALLIVVFLFALPSRTPSPKRSIFDFSNSSERTFREPYRADDADAYTLQPTSRYRGEVNLSLGNASSEYQPASEYIIIGNKWEKPVNITGWRLTNGKDRKVYQINNTFQHYPVEEAYIPSGAKLLTTNNIMGNIVLEPGDRAVITTGRPASGGSPAITSFKENICTGYLENTRNYEFTPGLDQQCPDAEREPGFQYLDEDCQEFIEDINSCHIPKIGGVDRDGRSCRNCADGEKLSSSCIAFIESHYTYQGCVANHALDSDFYLDTWRVYLGRTWEMWADDNEIISLFDGLGNLVDYRQY